MGRTQIGRIRNVLLIAVFGILLATALPAGAQTYVGVTPPQVGSSDPGGAHRSVIAAAASGPSSLARPAPAPVQRLALTGADITGMLLVAGLCAGVGLVLHRGARPRAT